MQHFATLSHRKAKILPIGRSFCSLANRIDIWPKDWAAGKDPQLEKAIELAKKALKDNPPKEDKRPAYPKRAVPK